MTKMITSNLQNHYREIKQRHIIDLMSADPKRFENCSVEAVGILFEFAKQHLNQQTIDYLLAWAQQRALKDKILALAAGEKVNHTEHKAALHMRLRDVSSEALIGAKDTVVDFKASLQQLQQRSAYFHDLKHQKFTDIIHIGVGGSYLGPALLYDAFKSLGAAKLQCHFLADLVEPSSLLKKLNPKQTLVVIASKSFDTQEPLWLAKCCQQWLSQNLAEETAAQQLFAVTAHKEKAQAMGISNDNIFSIDTSIGGRYSLWSAMSFSIMLAFGFECFQQLLAGAHALDQHFLTTELAHNLPVMHALIALWQRQFLKIPHYALLAYETGLKLLPKYCQQLWMESLGKSVDSNGQVITGCSGPLVWGDLGVLSQHSVAQWLHQGSEPVQVEFIIAANSQAHSMVRQQLWANCLSQARTLLVGKSKNSAAKSLKAQGYSQQEIERLLPYQQLAGNRGSQTLVLQQWDAYHLGALLAMYEHSVYVQSVMLNINAFDQFGVEWSKQLATTLQTDLEQGRQSRCYDASTTGLLNYYQAKQSCS